MKTFLRYSLHKVNIGHFTAISRKTWVHEIVLRGNNDKSKPNKNIAIPINILKI